MVKEDTSCDKRVFVIIGGGEFVHSVHASCRNSWFVMWVVKV